VDVKFAALLSLEIGYWTAYSTLPSTFSCVAQCVRFSIQKNNQTRMVAPVNFLSRRLGPSTTSAVVLFG